jgi:hypothetical protein
VTPDVRLSEPVARHQFIHFQKGGCSTVPFLNKLLFWFRREEVTQHLSGPQMTVIDAE